MKHILTTAACSITLITSSYAATYNIDNSSNGLNANGITDNAGNLLAGTAGSVAIGFFNSDAEVVTATTAADLLDANWLNFGTSETSFLETQAPLNYRGVFDVAGTETTNLGNYSGKNIYVVMGNASSLLGSTDFLVYKFTSTFGADADEPINVGLVLDVNTYTPANLLLGSIGADMKVSPLASATQPTFKMQIIPEPSSIALLGLGVVGFVIRRRR